jgi:hypothetical protein
LVLLAELKQEKSFPVICSQETKAMLQRDLARQVRREGEPMSAASAGVRRLDKTEVESAWHRAKLEMETDDFLDVLADNLSGK